VAEPNIPRTVLGDGLHASQGRGAYGNEPAILEPGNPVRRGGPNSPAIILKEGLHIIIRQSVAFPIYRDLTVVPSVQAIKSAKPDAAVPSRQNRKNVGIRQALLDRDRWYGEVAKAVEAIKGGDPNIAFAILEKALDEFP
jgi:hypothetical protein